MTEIFRQTKEEKSAGSATLKLSAQTGTSINTLRNTEGSRRRGKPSCEAAG